MPEDEVRRQFEIDGCDSEQARYLVVAGRQLSQQWERSFGAQEFSTDRARAIGDTLGVDWSRVDLEQFRVGLGVEMEHKDITGGDPVLTGKIVLAHLKEKPDYYTRLTKAGLETEPGLTFAGEGDVCHVCQPFTKLVRDPKKFDACMARAKEIGEISTPKQLYELVRGDLEKQDQEVFVVICLDFRGSVRDYVEIGRGQRHRVAVDIEDVLRPIIASGCDGAAVLHGHPSGVAEPSDADGDLTEAIKKAMAVACPNVHLVDHVVVGMGEFYSFASNNWKPSGSVTKVGA